MVSGPEASGGCTRELNFAESSLLKSDGKGLRRVMLLTCKSNNRTTVRTAAQITPCRFLRAVLQVAVNRGAHALAQLASPARNVKILIFGILDVPILALD